MKYKLHIAWANNEELTRAAVASAADIGNIHLWPNNGAGVLTDLPVVKQTVLPEITPVSVINMMIQSSWDDDVMFWMHNDGFARPGIAQKFLETVTAHHLDPNDEKWGAIFTKYDVLCAFNMKAVREVGYWDAMFFQYTADPEYYGRMARAGWRFVNNPEMWGDGVEHRGSMTVRTDKLFNFRTQWRERTRFDKKYYEFKWGGQIGHETFSKPFEDFRPPKGKLAW